MTVDYVLTCAHNVCKFNEHFKTYIYFEEITFYRSHAGLDSELGKISYSGKYIVRNVYVHPKYDGLRDSGFDVALIWVQKIEDAFNRTIKNI